MNYLGTFTHPTTWALIFSTIIEKLGPEFYKWDNGIGFGENETELIISHRDGEQKAAFLLKNIDVCQPAVAGGWFTTLHEATKKVSGISLLGYRQKCRIKFRYDKQEKIGILLFGAGLNSTPIEEQVYIDPHGWMETEYVELIEILPWESTPQ